MLRDFLTSRRLKQLWYLPVLGAAMALMMLRILALAKLLDVPAFGVYSAGLLVSSTFCILGTLGLQSMLQRDMPVLLMHGRERASVCLLMQSVLVATACAALCLIVSAFASGLAGLTSVALAAGVLHGLSQQLFLLVTVESRSRGEAVRYAVQNFWRGTLILLACLALAVAGASPVQVLLAEAALSLALSAATLVTAVGRSGLSLWAATQLALHRLGQTRWGTAATLLLVSITGFFHLNIDRWFAAEWLSVERFALYAFAAVVLTVAGAAQSMVNASVYPMLARRFALHGARLTFRRAGALSLATLVGAGVLALPAHWLMGWAIDAWYAPYREALGLLGVFIAVAVLRVADYWSSFLMICGRERVLLGVNLGVLLMGVAAWAMLETGGGAMPSDPLAYAKLALVLTAGHSMVCALLAWLVQRKPAGTPAERLR